MSPTDSFDVEADAYEGLDLEAAATDALDTVAVRVMNQWMDNMREAGYHATGETINSLTIDRSEALVRRIGSDKVAAAVGEFGRPPGAGHPNVDALADWVHEQAGLPDRGETVEWDFGDGPQEVPFDQAVYLIGRAIDERGLPAYRFARRAAAEHDDAELERELQQRLDAQREE